MAAGFDTFRFSFILVGCAEPSGGKRNWNKEHGDVCWELVTQRDLGWVRASGGGREGERTRAAGTLGCQNV